MIRQLTVEQEGCEYRSFNLWLASRVLYRQEIKMRILRHNQAADCGTGKDEYRNFGKLT